MHIAVDIKQENEEMTKVRHILGISGGKDSAALAIYLKKTYQH